MMCSAWIEAMMWWMKAISTPTPTKASTTPPKTASDGTNGWSPARIVRTTTRQ